jgi:uroporphyrinogen-III synthase
MTTAHLQQPYKVTAFERQELHMLTLISACAQQALDQRLDQSKISGHLETLTGELQEWYNVST